MAEEQVNPFEQQPTQPKQQQFAWGGMPTITLQEGQPANAGGSSFQLSPEAMQMLWAPQQQAGLMPQQQPMLPQQTTIAPQQQLPQVNPLL
jgi:hypothetical protein